MMATAAPPICAARTARLNLRGIAGFLSSGTGLTGTVMPRSPEGRGTDGRAGADSHGKQSCKFAAGDIGQMTDFGMIRGKTVSSSQRR
jgi:hypothetical protein